MAKPYKKDMNEYLRDFIIDMSRYNEIWLLSIFIVFMLLTSFGVCVCVSFFLDDFEMLDFYGQCGRFETIVSNTSTVMIIALLDWGYAAMEYDGLVLLSYWMYIKN